MEVVYLPHVEVPFDVDVALDEGVDVEIEVFCGLDHASAEAVDSARRAVEILKSYGVEAVVIPKTVRWDFGLAYDLSFQSLNTPTVLVNGVVVSEGRVPSPEELVDYALASLGMQKEGPGIPIVPVASKRDDFISSAEHI